MTRATRAVIDLQALRHNFSIALQRAPGSHNLAIIKANGYGHGIVPVARALTDRSTGKSCPMSCPSMGPT